MVDDSGLLNCKGLAVSALILVKSMAAVSQHWRYPKLSANDQLQSFSFQPRLARWPYAICTHRERLLHYGFAWR